MADSHVRTAVLGITPFAEPRAALVVAVERAGALGVLDLGRDPVRAAAELADVCRWWTGSFGVRIVGRCPVDLPSAVDTVVLGAATTVESGALPARCRLLAEVTSLAEARTAVAAGASGLIARGNEAGGPVGELTTFVLLQQLLGDPELRVPVWAAGGIGLHTAAAAMAGGAAGVVLDTQLALTSEVDLAPEVRAAIRAMDGSETAVIGGHRIYVRPDLPPAPPAEIASRLGSASLHTHFLPIGQDGPLARTLADAHRTAGGVVQAVRAAMASHLREANQTRPLAAGSEFARRHGLGVPLAQGPMTRVSDRAAFAAEVADGGGLPFLALALMPGHEVRALLAETSALLGDRPWGVGILGFVPPEIRAAQLGVVLEVRPKYALIAGGRPAQAAPLEAAGIATYLHVPSPGLLDRFLAEGARRFVFEGRECGGHVGPRASFPLWDQQIERLLDFGNRPAAGPGFYPSLDVLFAGGIHDGRSGAMVSALAAPLASRGAAIGALMGTAYLFTSEAVSAGAIRPVFQAEALGCDRTVLLETSPGHAVRCAESGYVQAFRAAKHELSNAGIGHDEMWQRLEDLNLGRLRIASKGVVRRDGELAQIGEDTQRSDGMFMLGDAATLRSRTTTIDALHRDVTEGGTAYLENAQAHRPEPARITLTDRGPAPGDVAIVGMACVLPGSADTASYWSAVTGGRDAVTEVPPDRWDPDVYYDATATGADAGRRSISRWGGFLPPIPFDALAYGIPPASLAGIEPVQLLALEVSARALADAGYATRPFDRSRASVIFGAEAGTDLSSAYGFRSAYPAYLGDLPPELDEQLPRLTEDSFPGVLANVIAGRIANRLDLGGANYTVDAACASSLAALDLACKELRSGTSDLVLCGGADLHNGAHDFLLFSSVHALSPTGKCRPFDSTADGIALGEGVACVVVKRLADAERDGDRVYAVIRSVAGSSDGRSLGLTAPRPDGQRRALERAYDRAGISPAAVGLIEAHGTGTVVGDRTELATLTEVFAEAGADPASCSLGSVKSQIGHTKCAAGMAGLIKAARALHTGVRPPTLHISAPNQFWDRGTSPFYFDSAAQPWLTPPAQRIAGVSAFGFGGTNFHAVLSGYAGAPEPAHGLDEWPAELFLFRGADRQAAESSMDGLAALLDAGEAAGRPWRLRDLARTTCGTGSQPVWAAIVATGLDDLGRKLALARTGGTGEGVFAADPLGGQVAFLFPGQGSQRPGMLAGLFTAFPRLQRHLRADGVPAARMYPPATTDPAEQSRQRAELTDTRIAQPALGAAGLAVHELLASAGVRPDLAGGHSYGELVALCAAGALREDELAGLSVARGEAILGAAGADPGGMAAVTAGPERIQAVLDRDPVCAGVVIANRNAPEQTVISGPTEALGVAADRLAAEGLAVTRIPVACAFHSPLVAAAAGTLAAELATRAVGAPAFAVWSNSTAAPYGADPGAVRDTLARQVADPVRFTEQVESMYAAGARIFVEAGPGRVLTGLTRRILGDRPHRAIAVDVPGEPGLPRFLHALAELAVAGASVDPSVLFAGRDAHLVSARAVPRRPGWIVDGHTVRTADGEYLPNGLRPATRVNLSIPYVPGAVEAAMSPSPSGALPARDQAVLEYLRGARELIAAQRDVLLGYLGSAPPTPQQFTVPAMVELVSAAPVVTPAEVAAPPAEAAPVTAEDVLAAVLAVVSERTGYPPDMLDPDLDLEADLSIDSIKRTEILAELTNRIALPGAGGNALDDSAVESLARIKTLRGIVAWITDPPAAETPAVAVRRHVIRMSALPALPPATTSGFGGHKFVLVEDAMSVGLELADLLRQRGGDVQMVPADAGPAAVAGAGTVVHLAALDRTGQPILPASFATLRAAILGGARRLLLVTCAGGQLGHGRIADPATAATGAGLPGLARALAREFPGGRISAVDVDPKQEPERIALALLAELDAPDGPPVVGLTAEGRVTAAVEPLELGHGTDLPSAASLGLSAASVVLLTGGARGITAQTALALARTSGCHIELIGRTPEPSGAEDPSTASAADPVALRRALIAAGVRSPAEVEAAMQRLLAERAVRSTLDGLREAAATVRYHVADVRDAAAVEAIVAGIYTRHGRLDGVVHGAGVLDDKLLADKTPESFDSVYGTKVDGARALAAALRPDCGFLVLFGSVSGVYGNRGQCDYSAANDSLDLLARIWAPRFTGRVVAIDWGPWAPAAGGMVSPELEREYARRGVELIAPEDGVGSLLRELAWGGREPQVVYVAGALGTVGDDA